jgi:hypothetical protein
MGEFKRKSDGRRKFLRDSEDEVFRRRSACGRSTSPPIPYDPPPTAASRTPFPDRLRSNHSLSRGAAPPLTPPPPIPGYESLFLRVGGPVPARVSLSGSNKYSALSGFMRTKNSSCCARALRTASEMPRVHCIATRMG